MTRKIDMEEDLFQQILNPKEEKTEEKAETSSKKACYINYGITFLLIAILLTRLVFYLRGY